MRRREKFVVISLLLSVLLLIVQYVPLDFRYLAVALFGSVTYLLSAWALSEDLQTFEWWTILPFPSVYAISVALFYFLLPESFLSRVIMFAVFGVGLYAVFLACNIFSVAKGRTIQLLHAARAIGLLFTLITSTLLLNTIFSLRLAWYINGFLVFISHVPLILSALWSIQLEQAVPKPIVRISLLFSLLLGEIAIALSLIPLTIWNSSLFTMAFLYLGLGVIQNFLQGRLFRNITIEYSLVGLLALSVFLLLFPGK